MRVSLNWLKEYASVIPEDVNVLSERLAMSGFMLDNQIEKLGDDIVLDLEFRRNRPDCEGMVGMAREVVAAFGGELKEPELADLSSARELRECRVIISAPELVNRFFVAHIKVQVKETPEWMRKRIKAYGMEVDGNVVVDITNYVMLELGQPLHAFDLGALRGNTGGEDVKPELELVRAKNGQSITLIGKKKAVLEDGDLLIAQNGEPIAIAGVMGGEKTGTREETVEIILEAANYDRVAVRLTSRRLGLMTEAADRLQKDLDQNLPQIAIRRALYLLQKEADAELVAISDYYPAVAKPKTVEFNPSEVLRYCGVEVPEFDMAEILEALGFDPDREREENKTWRVTVPTFRTDVELSVDIVEEIVRIWGYDKIPVRTMETPIPAPIHMREYEFEDKARDLLTAMSLDELITIGATTLPGLKRAYKNPDDSEIGKTIRIETPPNEYYQCLRTNMFATMLDNVKARVDSAEERIAVFEVGRVYFDAPDKKIEDPKMDVPYTESRRIAGVLSGKSLPGSWALGTKTPLFTLYDAKGIVSELCEELGIAFEWKPGDHPSFEIGTVISLVISGRVMGYVGQVASDVAKKWDIGCPLYAFELLTDFLAYAERGYKKMSRWSSYPKVTRDISLIVKKDITNEEVVSLINEAGGEILFEVEPIDVYAGEKIAAGTKNIVYSLTYWSKKKTLTAKEVEAAHRKIGDRLIKKLKAKISGWGEMKVTEEKPAEPLEAEAGGGLVVVGKILKVEKHPDADRLAVVQVDVGEGRQLQIVCGAENIVNGGQSVIGALVPVALPGATVQMATNKERTEYRACEVKSVDLRGIKSDGMLCSKLELGKGKDDEGIWVLDKGKYQIGQSLEGSA